MLLVAAGVAAGHSGAPMWDGPPLSFALAGSGCTQEDIPAVEIFLTTRWWDGKDSPPIPYVRIEAAGLTPGAPGALELSPLRRDPSRRTLARAELHRDGGGPAWLSGSLRLGGVTAGRPVEGTYTFCVEPGRCLEGRFSAPWRPGRARCG